MEIKKIVFNGTTFILPKELEIEDEKINRIELTCDKLLYILLTLLCEKENEDGNN